MNLIHLESRPSKQSKGDYDFFVNCDNTKGGLQEAIEILKKKTKFFHLLSRNVEAANNDDDIGLYFRVKSVYDNVYFNWRVQFILFYILFFI